MKIKIDKVVFLIMLLGLISGIRGSWIYRPLSTAIPKTNLVVTAHVLSYETIDNRKHACAKLITVLYGDWFIDSIIQLPIRQKPDTGVISSAFCEVLYDSNTPYLLLLKKKNGYIDLADYPWLAQFKLDSTNVSLVDDVVELIRIEGIPDTIEKALAYRELLISPYVDVRESVAWELSKLRCEEALHTLLIAMKDTTKNVLVNALAGLYLLGKKGVTSREVVASLESLLVYQPYSSMLYRAYAAQNGEKAIPLLHRHSYLHDPREGVLNALTILRDTTALDYFREVILFPRPSQSLRHYALQILSMPDTLTIPFPDSVVISWAIYALSDTNESIQKTAIKLLEKKTGLDFGYATGGPNERAKQRKKIIKKWQKWYKQWLEDKRKGDN